MPENFLADAFGARCRTLQLGCIQIGESRTGHSVCRGEVLESEESKMAARIVMENSKVVMITGGARRIGAELVRHLHRHDMRVILHYCNSQTDARALAGELNARRSDSVRLLQGDLTEYAKIPAMMEQAFRLFERLDVLVNNASVFFPTDIGDINEDAWERLVGANLKAPLYLIQAAAPHLKSTRGCVVNIVDIHADRPLKGYPLYSISKAGLAMLTRSMARELAPEIRVNGIAPGAILWPEAEHYEAMHQEIISRTALKREGSPCDIADAALFLIRHADYVTGQIIAVDGGRTLSN